ncbi:DeoR family transcriptional regulator [Actinophytocola oryzae]|uniref:DeoR family transcriptional regulator n=1 Tax=Actinophytocola oryzae TaxID=502181 RepID=A0A4R7VRH8_9PSEU|nr:DeoR family transcriptional regulator [Actinophytocola oryzae]
MVSRVFAAERRQRIVELVRSSGAISLRELARQVQTSEVTVRRDLRALAAQGLLDRHHGGAALPGGLSHEPTYSEKALVASDAKAAIATLAADLVSDGDAIVVGAGTTTQAFAARLTRHNELTVVTNSLLVATDLAGARGVDVVMTGGTLRGSIHALVGGTTEQALSSIRGTRAFISGNGLTAARGLSTPNLTVAGVDRALAGAAREVVVLADHTKIGTEALLQTVATEDIQHLVTDDASDAAELDALRELGITVHVASVPTTTS